MSKQTATHLVDQLERAGYVERVVDPSDARARLVRMSPRGAEVIAVARAEEARIDEEWTKHLGGPRMRELRDSLTLLREITTLTRDPASLVITTTESANVWRSMLM